MELTLTKENFNKEVLESEKEVIVDFWAAWCGPCRMLGPVIEEIANERDDLVVGKLNVDEQPEIARQFGVMSIPTVIIFKNGKAINQSVGYVPKKKILALL